MAIELLSNQSSTDLSFETQARSWAPPPAFATGSMLRRLSELTGMPFVCVDVRRNAVLARSEPDVLPVLPRDLSSQLRSQALPHVFEYETGLLVCAFPLSDDHVVAVGWTLSRPGARPSEVVMAAAAQGWTEQKLEALLSAQPCCSRRFLETLLERVATQLGHEARETALQSEMNQIVEQLEATYEEISMLHALTRNLQVSRSSSDLAQLCLDRIQGRIDCEGTAMWIKDKHGNLELIVRGTLPLDAPGVARLIARFESGDWSRPLVKNGISGALSAEFPNLKNMVIVPIGDTPNRAGWIISCNVRDAREYGTVEASLINSIAMILATHARNIDLFKQNADLLLGFVRSLVSTIDAKDPYTRGHSERVALIARRLGEYLELPKDDLQDLYLAGLLHDVGKIGVDDRILRKPGSLTPEEFAEIQKHPMIGFNILHELKNLQQVLPGVRNHHECINGRGYPDGLAGDDIPLMARILAVADSFDAMSSDRPYRNGMPIQKIEDIFRGGSGVQWDSAVIDAYFAVRDELGGLCSDYRPRTDSLLATTDSAPVP
jgi:HD-GYP domain-containing protein (c-di-GMP phosphodiesterase class II)